MALPEDQQLDTLLGYMLAQASEASGIADLDPDQPLLELGLDSLRAAEFAVQVPRPVPVHPALRAPRRAELSCMNRLVTKSCQALAKGSTHPSV